MSIESEINRIITNVQNTLATIEEMGGEVPEDGNSDDMAGGVKTIPIGAKIDDTTPSDTTTYSSQKIETEFSKLSEKMEVVPDYVTAEADAVISRTLDAQTSGRVFTLAAISDMHYGSGGYTDGILHASQALKRIAGRIKLDALAVTGDYTDLYINSDYAAGIADVQAVNALLSGVDADTLALVGNHDYHAAGSPKLARTLLGKSDDVVWGSRTGGYYYRDFGDYKLRVVALNTSETGNSNISCSSDQYNWFISTLDMSAKTDAADWQILILSHHPLDWYENAGDGVWRFANIINAYDGGKSWSGGGLSCDFTGKNAANIVCNVHGHIHNLRVDKIKIGNPSNPTGTTRVYRMCIPESCIDRPQSYGAPWNTETAYTKTANTADDTSFAVLCIDLANYTIRSVNYGAGIDRELVYYDPTASKYTNMLLKSVGSDGKPFNGGRGWIKGYRLNSSGAQAENADYFVTGFIPIKDRDTLYLRNMNFVVGGTDTQPNTRLCTYNASFGALTNMLVGDVPNSTIFNAIILDEDGGTLATGDAIGRMRIDAYNDNVAYIRFSTKGMSDESIVTVNEPII